MFWICSFANILNSACGVTLVDGLLRSDHDAVHFSMMVIDIDQSARFTILSKLILKISCLMCSGTWCYWATILTEDWEQFFYYYNYYYYYCLTVQNKTHEYVIKKVTIYNCTEGLIVHSLNILIQHTKQLTY